MHWLGIAICLTLLGYCIDRFRKDLANDIAKALRPPDDPNKPKGIQALVFPDSPKDSGGSAGSPDHHTSPHTTAQPPEAAPVRDATKKTWGRYQQTS